MFVKYQKVRNAVVGTATAIVGGIAAFFGLRGDDSPPSTEAPRTVAVVQDHVVADSPPIHLSSQPVTTALAEVEAPRHPSKPAPPHVHNVQAEADPVEVEVTPPIERKPISRQERYEMAMKIATSKADPSGKGKDVLGASSPWKLNLYDDNRDGQWDRGKLDYNRDDLADEKWNYKQGRWEKDGGNALWIGDRWVTSSTERVSSNDRSGGQESLRVSEKLIGYRKAMKIATSRAAASGKGKDVLGSGSPWKLNLYDDNKDGQWDRAKLDYDRDEVDDEKWNFKKGRWEKDGGASIWNGSDWQPE